MKLKEALNKIQEHKQMIAVYDEVLHYLAKAGQEDFEIPMSSGSDQSFVDLKYVQLVTDQISEKRAEQSAEIDKITDMEVAVGKGTTRKRKTTSGKPRAKRKAANS
tara:strand:+ start:1314 stop:1631 length:318 start_codon:yes stop_codon:yes gene_type:complete